MLTHAARAAAKQLNFRHLWWPRAGRAKGSGQSNQEASEGNFHNEGG